MNESVLLESVLLDSTSMQISSIAELLEIYNDNVY